MKRLSELYEELVEHYAKFCTMPGVRVEVEILRLQERGYSREEAIVELYKRALRVGEVEVMSGAEPGRPEARAIVYGREESASVVAHMALRASVLLGAWTPSLLVISPSIEESWRTVALLGGASPAALWAAFFALRASKRLKAGRG